MDRIEIDGLEIIPIPDTIDTEGEELFTAIREAGFIRTGESRC